MAQTYDLVKDFNITSNSSTPQTVSVSSGWVVAIFPYQNQITGNRSKLLSSNVNDVSFTKEADVKTNPTIIISHGCVSLTVSAQKENHTMSLQAELAPTRNFIKECHPGDWVMAWMCQNQEEINKIIKIINTTNTYVGGSARANYFNSGLKFVGKIWSVSQNGSIDGSGDKRISYSLNAYGFSELDNEILYFYAIELASQTYGDWMSRMGILFNDIVVEGEADINLLYPAMIQATLGNKTATGTPNPAGSIPELPLTPNVPYAIPGNVYSYLTGNPYSGGTKAYTDIMAAFIGIQDYGSSSLTENNTFGIFLPKTSTPIESDFPKLYATKTPMIGRTPPIPPSLDYKPIWNMLGEFLNPGLNEMYMALRVADNSGNIYPTFVSRQKPFTTNELDQDIKTANSSSSSLNTTNFPYTKFTDLPRWLIDDEIILNYSVSNDNSLRHNMIDIVGVSPAFDTVQNAPRDRFLRASPKWDSTDISRNGVRAFMQNVNATIQDVNQNNPQWVAFNADILMNQQLQLTGTFVVHGIQSPIAIGDNLQYKDVVYHIEGLAHSCSIDRGGNKRFFTTIQVTNGMTSDKYGEYIGVYMYPTLTKNINIGNEPAIDGTQITKGSQ